MIKLKTLKLCQNNLCQKPACSKPETLGTFYVINPNSLKKRTKSCKSLSQ